MLLNMMCGRRLSAISLCLAVTFAPLFNAQADEPEVIPGDSPVAVSEQGEALPQAQATAIMAGIQPLPEGAADKSNLNYPQVTSRFILTSFNCCMPHAICNPCGKTVMLLKPSSNSWQRWRLPVSSRSLING